MGYYIDLHKISLLDYKKYLSENELLPSRRILKDNLEQNFNLIKVQGIENLAQLQQTLKSKSKFQQFAIATGIDENYLKILIREINSLHPKPTPLAEFHEISEITIQRLNELKIKTTVDLFDHIHTPNARNELSNNTEIPMTDIMLLTKFTDVSRIRWVGSTFARVLVTTGYDTVQRIANADYQKMYIAITEFNKKEKMYKGNIGLNDMKLTVLAAQQVPKDIKYSNIP